MASDLERHWAELEAEYDEMYGSDWECRWEDEEVVFEAYPALDVYSALEEYPALEAYPSLEDDEDDEADGDVLLGVDREERVLDHVWRRAGQQ